MTKRALWEAYRNDPRSCAGTMQYRERRARYMERALRSRYCIVPAHDLYNEDEAVILSEYVLLTLVSYEWSMPC